ncbi:MAG: HlyD family secretion protein, partial [Anaerolineae bacterium]|nr:HlyD family secretion protein [Anaerolineae bacterium]
MRRNPAFGGALLVLLVMLAGCTPELLPTSVITPLAAHQAGAARSGDVSASGRVISAQETQLSFAMLGRVDAVTVAVGDLVDAGHPLIQLDTADLEANVALAEATLAVAQRERARLNAPPDGAAIAAAEANVRAAAAAVTQTLVLRNAPALGATEVEESSTRAALAAAMANRQEAYETHEIMLTCVDIEGYGKICPLLGAPEENTRFQWEATEAGLQGAEAEMSAVEPRGLAEIRVANANITLAKAQQMLAEAYLAQVRTPATAQEIEAADAVVTEARAAVAAAQTALKPATLAAPRAGTVIDIFVEVGEVAQPAQTAITLADLD